MGRHQGYGNPFRTRPTGTAHTVQIVVATAWHIEVDHQVQFADIQTTGCHIRGHQHPAAALLEPLDGQLAILLVLLAMQHIYAQPFHRPQHTIQAISHDPRIGEDNRLALTFIEQQPFDQCLAVRIIIHRNHLLANSRGIVAHTVQL